MSFLSILGEKVMACRTIVHIQHAIIDKFQSIYMFGQSSETSLFRVYSDIVATICKVS